MDRVLSGGDVERRDPRCTNSREEEGGSGVGSGNRKSPDLPGVYAGPRGMCHVKPRGQRGAD